jgi:hypothetical protein
MKRVILILINILFLILIVNIISASDVLAWQGQYYTGTTFNTGTYEFNFTVYDALAGGNACYSNTTTLTTGSFGEWKTEQSGVGASCNNASKDYYLNINIDGTDQTPRRRLAVWDFLRKNVDEITAGSLRIDSQVIAPVVQANSQIVAPTINATSEVITSNLTATTGFFSYLGGLADIITKLFVKDIDASGNINATGNVTADNFFGDGSHLTGINGAYGEMYNSTEGGTLELTNQNEWYNITGFSSGFNNGWYFNSTTNELICNSSGIYRVIYSITFALSAASQIEIQVIINNVADEKSISIDSSSSNTYQTSTYTYLQNYSVGDKLVIQVMNIEASGKVMTFRNRNLIVDKLS